MILDRNPKANPKNSIVYGHARFTILSDRFLRLEWSEDGRFVDLASIKVVNRNTPLVSFHKYHGNRQLELYCRGLKVRYHDDGKPFSQTNLEITFSFDNRLSGKREQVSWNPGTSDTGNLLGTCRTLDECDGDTYRSFDKKTKRKVELEQGLLSTSGWTLVDDSGSILLRTLENGRQWFSPRPDTHKQDFYFLAFGHDYQQALNEASEVFGRQPLPPRYALGLWWSRYWPYTDQDLLCLLDRFDEMGFPLDVMVLDVNWHLDGWTGYTWNRDYFPDPKDFLEIVKARGLRVALNLHPAEGVGKHEEMFVCMAQAVGAIPQHMDRILFDCADPNYIQAYFQLLLHPREREGVDFWWIDWQQGTDSRIPGLDPLPWLNLQHWEDRNKSSSLPATEKGKEAKKIRTDGISKSMRPLILSRFGGLGSGRYPVGFSGDTHSTWKSLSYQPYFTTTAANSLYGFWSHDIGGHWPGVIEPELYTRWIQFGVYSPILRTHATMNPDAERRIWAYPDSYATIMKQALFRRYELVPYIYTEIRKCFENGLSLCRPLYHAWPGEREAYRTPTQYQFGSRMLLSPVTQATDPKSDLARISVWLPPGDWIDTSMDQLLAGGQRIDRSYTLSEIPVFVRPGTIIPGQFDVRRLTDKSYKNLLVEIWPGAEGAYLLYEDDGVSQTYLQGAEVWINLGYSENETTQYLEIRKAEGKYPQLALKKSLEIRLYATPPPSEVTVGRFVLPRLRTIGASNKPGTSGWVYNGNRFAVRIRLSAFDLIRGAIIKIKKDRLLPSGKLYGMFGLLRRLDLIRVHAARSTGFYRHYPEKELLVRLAQTGYRLSRQPERFYEELRHLKNGLLRLPKVLTEMDTDGQCHPLFSSKHLGKARVLWEATNNELADTISCLEATFK